MGTERHHLVVTVRFDCCPGGISQETSLPKVSHRNIAQLKSALGDQYFFLLKHATREARVAGSTGRLKSELFSLFCFVSFFFCLAHNFVL